jgi:hypothetical protein
MAAKISQGLGFSVEHAAFVPECDCIEVATSADDATIE